MAAAGCGREVQEGEGTYVYVYIYICNRIGCTEETNTALHSDYTPIKNKFY